MDTTRRIRPGIAHVMRTALLVGVNLHVLTDNARLAPVALGASALVLLWGRRRAAQAR